jgi:hypothetical protein
MKYGTKVAKLNKKTNHLRDIGNPHANEVLKPQS